MLIAQQERTCEVGTDAPIHNMQIAASPQMFRILSTNIYTQKELAVVRETLCNAWDAHIMAGTQETPIEIHMPTMWEPYYEIKDFGTGLAESAIYELYMTYGRSDKTTLEDNVNAANLIGGKGIGGKSPFAYTDQFTVTSRVNGRIMVFQAYINADGVPACVKMHEYEDANEPNGVTIHVPVADSAAYRPFEQALGDLYPLVPTAPVVTPTTPERQRFALSHYPVVVDDFDANATITKVAMRERAGGYSRYGWGDCNIVQGIPPYKLNFHDIFGDQHEARQYLDPGEIQIVSKYDMLLWSDIGSFDVDAGRENIELTQTVKQNLRTAIKAALTHILASLTAKLDDVTTWFEWHTVAKTLPFETPFPDRIKNTMPSVIASQMSTGTRGTPTIRAAYFNDMGTNENITRVVPDRLARGRNTKDGYRRETQSWITADELNMTGLVVYTQAKPNWPVTTFLKDTHFASSNDPALICVGTVDDVTARLAKLGVTHIPVRELPYIKAARGSRTAQARKLGATKYHTTTLYWSEESMRWQTSTMQANAEDLLALADNNDDEEYAQREMLVATAAPFPNLDRIAISLRADLLTLPKDVRLHSAAIPDHHNRVQDKVFEFFGDNAGRQLVGSNIPLRIRANRVRELAHCRYVINELTKRFGLERATRLNSNETLTALLQPFHDRKGAAGSIARIMNWAYQTYRHYWPLSDDFNVHQMVLRDLGVEYRYYEPPEDPPELVDRIHARAGYLARFIRLTETQTPAIHPLLNDYGKALSRALYTDMNVRALNHWFTIEERHRKAMIPLMELAAKTLPKQEH